MTALFSFWAAHAGELALLTRQHLLLRQNQKPSSQAKRNRLNLPLSQKAAAVSLLG